MIYTVTFNPSLDYVMKVENFEEGIVCRSESEEIYAGGKGINVSMVLKNLDIESVALGFIAGFTGDEIENRLREFGCKTDFIKLPKGLSRINVKLKSKKESDINGAGPSINEFLLEHLINQIEELKDGDILVLAGSIPKCITEDIYRNIMISVIGKKIEVVVDATKDLLLNVLKYKPFLIKPNNHELGEIFNKELKSDEEIIYYGKKLQEKGAQNVLISMAGDGAILLTSSGETYKRAVPKGKLINSVGAGDSMVAGFLAGYLKNKDFNEAFKMGIAAGSASAFSEMLATKEEIIELLERL